VASFAERLNQLFSAVYPAGRGPHTLQEVCVAVNAEGAAKLSPSYLSQLRNGQKTNPSAATVAALARFFKVKPDFFYDDEYAEQMERDLAMLAKLRDSGVHSIAARAFDLSPEARESVSMLVDQLRRYEGLPEGGEDDSAH